MYNKQKIQDNSVLTLALYIYFELCCFVVGVFSFQSTQLSGFVLNGKVTVVSKGTSAIV